MELHFKRFELKYIIPKAIASSFVYQLRDRLELDPHAIDGTYRISSIYYDSPDYRCFKEKIDGIDYRYKLRLRHYGNFEKGISHGFFEIKYRKGDWVYKKRCYCNPTVFKSLSQSPLELNNLVDSLKNDQTQETARILKHTIEVNKFKPLVHISYIRTPYISNSDQDIRITIDEECHASRPDFELDSSESIPFNDNMVVLEVKFNYTCPLWLREALNHLKLRQVRFSKYAEGTKCLSSMSHFSLP